MDTTTIFEITTIVIASLFLYLLVIHISTPALRGMRYICYAYGLGCMGMQLLAFRGRIPAFFSVLVGQFILINVNVCLYRGLAALLRLRRSWFWFAVLSAIPVLTITPYFTFVNVHVVPPILAFSAVMFLQNTWLSLMVARHGNATTRAPRIGVSVLCALWATGNLMRIFFVLTRPHPSIYPSPDSYNAMVVVIPVLTAALTGIAFLWLAMCRLQQELEMQSRTDALTGLLNRRALDLTAAREIARSRRANTPLSTILLDLDSFKSINDRYGHDAGDFALSVAANHLSESLRSIDLIARLGGEEFVIFLPDATGPVASEIAERLRVDLAGLPVRHNNHEFRLSASFGVTELTVDDLTWEDMLRRADRALYRAKNEGRNRTVTL